MGYHYLQKKENTLNFVDNDDLSKLNIKKQDVLPSSTSLLELPLVTLDYIDNELNHLINNQFKESKIKNKV